MRAQVRTAPGHSPQRVEQLRGRGLLDYVAAGACADGTDNRVLVVVHRKHDDPRGRTVAQQLDDTVDAIQSRKTDVHQNNIRAEVGADLDRLGAGFYVADDGKFAATIEQGSNPLAHDLVILNDQYAVGHGPSPLRA